MLSARGRRPVAVVVEPVAAALNRAGVSPNALTVAGTAAASGIAVALIPAGHLFAAAVLTAVFTFFDLLDGTMARLRGGGTRFGAVLDAGCDRITDGALFGAILWWLAHDGHGHPAIQAACLVTLVASQVVSYVKARAEASGIAVDGGLVERAERLILALVGLGLAGLGVPHALDVALVALALGSAATVVQRILIAGRDPRAGDPIAAPKGAAG